jgi:hypothetical protein
MPSLHVRALIVAFWLLTTAFVAYRDLWPVLFASGPPPLAIDLADEAAQTAPVRWTIHFSGQSKPGRLITQMKYQESDDTFAFTNTYSELRYESAGVAVSVPKLTNVIRVTREGDLREQTVDGRLEFFFRALPVGNAEARIVGTVVDGQLIAKVEANYTIASLSPQRLSRTLEPIPVPRGQPLNPLQPVNRIADLRPGRRWVVRESDPLKEIIGVLAGDFGFRLPDEKRDPLIGEVLSSRQEMDWNGEAVLCWVIEYRRDEPVARTWVRASDGKVLKQEAFQKGETLTLVRDF